MRFSLRSAALALVVLFAGIMVTSTVSRSLASPDAPAEDVKGSLQHVQVFAMDQGLTGFFDPATRRIYVYKHLGQNPSALFVECVAVLQINEMGLKPNAIEIPTSPPMQPSGEAGGFEVEDQASPPGDR